MQTGLGEVARELVDIVKQLDTTRPVTAGLASALMSNETGYSDALDVAGYNYQEFRYAPDHQKYPKMDLFMEVKTVWRLKPGMLLQIMIL